MKTTLLSALVLLAACGRAAPGGEVPAASCLSAELRENGVPGTPPRHPIACRFQQWDEGGPVAKGENQFDARGNVTSAYVERLDDPPRSTVHDGTFLIFPRKSLTRAQFDSADRKIFESYDEGADGALEWKRSWTFDPDGRELVTEFHGESHSVWTTRKRDALGYLISEETWDGVYRRLTEWTRTATGQPLTQEDFEGDRVLQRRSTWTYDASGVLRASEIKNAKGEFLERSTYDVNGRLVERRSPWDRVQDQIQQLTWDARGNLLRDHRFEASGKEIEDHVRTFDAQDRELTWWHRWGHSLINGPNTDELVRTLGPCGEVLTESMTTNGKPRSSASAQYDAAGHQVFVERLNFLPSQTGFRVRSSFDGFGRLIAVHTDALSKGTWATLSDRTRVFDGLGHLVSDRTVGVERDWASTWKFDAAGELIETRSNVNFGNHDDRVELSYGCF